MIKSHSPCMVQHNLKMENALKAALNTSTLTRTGHSGGGCINQGEAYITDSGTVFVKSNKKSKARLMFDGEFEGLSAIAATNTVLVPKPIKVLDNPDGGACLVMEFLEMKGLRRFSAQLGDSLAKMHLYNDSLSTKDPGHVKEFGFHAPTCCGYIPQDNSWKDDWVSFFAQNRLDHQFRLLEKELDNDPIAESKPVAIIKRRFGSLDGNKKGDREANELWARLQIVLPTFFKDLEIKPSLLHGDLWGGNAAETKTNPVIFDPATFYGHHEYDLAIAGMFGGFNRSFYDAYHKIIPKAAGFENRHKLYQLFHYLNHWNHFGSGYRGSTISTMKSLLK